MRHPASQILRRARGSASVSSPLVGLHSDAAPPQQTELFAAWTRYLTSLAASGPTVLVVEDLHWADSALVDFLIQLADTTEHAPVLILVTARPEVAVRHPAWLERAGKSTLVQLTSLSDDEITALVEFHPGRRVGGIPCNRARARCGQPAVCRAACRARP